MQSRARPGRALGAPIRWSSASVDAHERLAAWNDVVSDAFVPVSVRGESADAFSGTVTGQRMGALGVAQIDAQAQHVARTPEQIQRRAGDVYFLNMPLTSGATIRQATRTAALAPGDFALVDGAAPFELSFAGEFRQISLTLPHALLAPLLRAPAQATAVRVPGDRGVGAIAGGAVLALATSLQGIDAEQAVALQQQLAGMIALAIGGVCRPPRGARRATLLQAAKDAAERRAGDPELTPASVAEQVGISTRYLHRLFSDDGLSFGRWLHRRRLELARRDLIDPLYGHWTITQIALEHGFRDPSHFARAFREAYGHAPRDARAADRPASRGTG